jgi:hypothetical protein
MNTELGLTSTSVEPGTRVCPDCGSPAGTQPFCSNCGRNLSLIERLPTRAEWDTSRSSAPESAEDRGERGAVAKALASLEPWWVALTDGTSETNRDTLVRSVEGHVRGAVDASGTLPVEINGSVRGGKLDLLASIPLADGHSVQQRFTASNAAGRGHSRVAPTGPINLIGLDGAVIKALGSSQPDESSANAQDEKSFLISAYIAAVLIPIIGLVIALYTAVSERKAGIRRHALGIAGASILTAVIWVLVVTAINSSNQDRNVAGDLRSLLDSNAISYSSVGSCAHQTGNQYVCMVTTSAGQQIPVQVTDDGKEIYEQGLSANGG